MHTLRITETDYTVAQQLIDLRPIYRNSHRGPAANEVGCLGEAVVQRVAKEHGIPLRSVFLTTHDFELPDRRTIEVKTKDRTVVPQPHFDCSVPDYVADHQNADFYIFVSLQRQRSKVEGLRRFHTAHIVGVASPALIRARGRLMDAGVTDVNGTTFWTACRNIPISGLVGFEAAAMFWKKQFAVMESF